MNRATSIFAAVLFLCSAVGSAGEHALGTIQGNNIDLKVYDHAVAGSIKDFVMFGAMDEENFSSELTMRKDGQIIKATFKKQDDGRIGGMIVHEVESKLVQTSIFFVGINKQENKIMLKVNDQDVTVAITADAFENNHFMNPTYKTVINGEEISYTMQGQACFGYSLHLAYMILGAYIH